MENYTKLFHKFEIDNDLFSINIKGHCFWDYIRYNVYEEINCRKYKKLSIKRKRSYRLFLKEFVAYIKMFLFQLFFQKKKYDIMLFNYSRTGVIDGKEVNIHTYPLVKNLKDHFNILLADFYSLKADLSGYPCDRLKMSPFSFIARFKSRFMHFSKSERDLFSELSLKIKQMFGENIDIYDCAKRIFSFQVTFEKTCLVLFKYYNPRILIYCDDGGVKGLINAAHKLGILAVDYQHAYVAFLNIHYNYPASTPWNIVKNNVSDYVFTFGDYWNSEYKLPVKPISVGFPFFDMQMASYCNKQVNVSANEKSRSIIVISVLISRDALMKIAMELSELLPDHTIYYKLRYEEYDDWHNYYPSDFLKRKNIVIVDSNHEPLYSYFNRCTYQLGTESTAMYEGMACGLTTFILKVGRYEGMKKVYSSDCAFLVSSASEVADKIRLGIKPNNVLVRENIFKPNSVQNIKSTINEILGSSNLPLTR